MLSGDSLEVDSSAIAGGIDTTGQDWYDDPSKFSPSKEITDLRNDGNLLTRVTESTNIVSQGLLLPIISEIYTNDDSNTIDDEVGIISQGAAALTSILIAVGLITIGKRKRFHNRFTAFAASQSVSHPDPAARRFKTSFVIGQKVGEAIAGVLFFELNVPLLGHSSKALIRLFGYPIALLFGIAGVLFFKSGIKIEDEKLHRIGKDGWTKYVKWGFVFGGAIGLVITMSLFTGGIGIFAAYPIAYLIGSAGGSLLGAAIVAAAVPIYHKIKYKILKRDYYTEAELKDATQYRTNFSRAGMVVGGLVIGIIFGILGATCWPALGIATGVVLGSAIGSVAFGALFAVIGPWIAKKVEHGAVPVNSFDYAIRTGALFGTNGLGLALSAIPVIGPILQLAAGLLTTIVAFAREWFHAKNLKGTNEKDGKGPLSNHILPWTQRAAPAIMLGGAIFGLIGFILFPPAGAAILGGVGALACGLGICGLEWLLRKKGYLPTKVEKDDSSKVMVEIDRTKSSTILLRRHFETPAAKPTTNLRRSAPDRKSNESDNQSHPPQPLSSLPHSHSTHFNLVRRPSAQAANNPNRKASNAY